MLGGARKSLKIDFPSMSQAQDLIKGVLPCLPQGRGDILIYWGMNRQLLIFAFRPVEVQSV